MKILLHICCGVCAAGVAERLKSEGHEVTGFFYNPNISPEDEYAKRLDAARTVSEKLGSPLIIGEYDHDSWLSAVKGHEADKECGERCEICYRVRLERTCKEMIKSGFEAMATTLTISPMKKALTVNRIGREVAGERFLSEDFKKKDGFKRTMELARTWGLYKQNYCGCEFGFRVQGTEY
jgi:predicted adenine nucleotide alpha hydrolase (AANH) superfamily ATPase